MGDTIDLLELQMLYEYNLQKTTMIDYYLQSNTVLYRKTYGVAAGELTELKKVPCCTPCYATNSNFTNKKRRFASNAARTASLKINILTCIPDYDSD